LASDPGRETGYPLYRRIGWPQTQRERPGTHCTGGQVGLRPRTRDLVPIVQEDRLASDPGRETGYPLYRRIGWPQTQGERPGTHSTGG
jgi:hypothetical protein